MTYSNIGKHISRTVLLSVGIVLTFVFVDLPGKTLFWSAVQNSGHTLAFLLLTLFLLFRSEKVRNNGLLSIITLAVTMLCVGLLIEFGQYLTGRGASYKDMLLNMAGIGSACLLFVGFKSKELNLNRTMSARYLSCVVAALLLAWAFRTPATIFFMERMETSLPTLLHFDNRLASLKIRAENAHATIGRFDQIWPDNSTNSLKVEFNPGRWPTVQFLEPPYDWREYTMLQFEIVNPNSLELAMYVRIDDASLGEGDDDHMTVQRIVPPLTTVKIEIPFDEFRKQAFRGQHPGKPTLGKVQSVLIYLSQEVEIKTLYFDRFDLR